MSIRLFRILLLVTLSPLSLFSQTLKGFKITGHIKGLEEGEKVALSIFDFKKMNWSIKDSALVKNGEFLISSEAPDSLGGYYAMSFNKHTNKFCRLYLDNEQIVSISCDSNISKIRPSTLDNYFNIKGSPTNEKWHLSQSSIDFYLTSMINLNGYVQKIKDSLGFNPALIESALKAREMSTESFIISSFYHWDQPYPKSVIPFEIVVHSLISYSGHAASFGDVYIGLDESIKKSHYGKLLKDYCRLLINQPFPEFKLPTVDGKLLMLKDVVSKGKLTLVHLWANKSAFRNEIEPELVMQYNKYHNQGFNIIGISADSYVEEWKEALDVDKYPWYNVIDLKGKITNEIYHEGGHRVPNTTDILVDEQGKIVAWDLTGIELQYYLWREFGS
ncbi:DUF4369 domain-containing protein [Chitinophaga oryziterrae]|uniref:DUF4369 domain-containing protein n=1 Tax=Chitinophaga oryziterrae TaxID=1031224 RepID=A0A6N8JIC6_9BACT|nr:TlpA disulfide reductase family protein [Chitinophaga oryziterrae]MVT44724.1 DUF4369 domain-containing protein [Chitinophaga oryziterrae]